MGIVKVMVDGEMKDFVTSLDDDVIEENNHFENGGNNSDLLTDDTIDLNEIINEINKGGVING